VNCHDEDEAPLEGALVRLSRDGSVFREQPTNAEGQAFFKQLVAGQYRVDGEKQGFRGQHRDINLGVLKPHVWPVKYRIWNEDGSKVLKDPPVEPGTTLKVQISTRLRLSILHFFPPFISITVANSLDSELLALLGQAHIDDISLVSVVKFVDDKANPSIKFIDEFWPMKKPDYLRMLIAECHKMGVQVIVGWAAVDDGKAIQHKNLVDFLSQADDAHIAILAENIAKFFFDVEKLDIDGFMFDFELNGLGPPKEMPADKAAQDAVNARVATQATNVRNLYRLTAEAIRLRKDDAFVSYCNAAFKADDENVISFMRVQTFDILKDVPNLIARPMCFFTHTIPADEIRASVTYAVTHAYDPAQLQYAVFARELPKDFDSLLTDTFRANRVGVALYQFPGVPAEKVTTEGKTPDQIAKERKAAQKKAAAESRAAQERFLTDAVAWNEKLNPGEAVPADPPVPGQPLQVPRRTP